MPGARAASEPARGEPPSPYGPAQVRAFVERDIARWTQFVETVGIERLKGEAQ